MQRIYLVRHGETSWNAQGRYLGQTDLDLNKKGREEAQALACRFRKICFDSIYCSGLKRTQVTAETIVKHHRRSCSKAMDQLEVKRLKGLNEFDFGAWEGLTADEIERKSPGMLEKWRRDITSFQVPRGETSSKFLSRIRRAFERALTENADETVVVVTHGGPIKAIIFSLLKCSTVDFSRLRIDSGSVSAVDFGERGEAIVWLLNDISHL